VRVPLVDLVAQHQAIEGEVMAAVAEVARAQAFVLGEPVARFERTLAGVAGAKHAVGVASGTDALVLALRALGVGEGDAVVVPSLTFVASAEAVVRAGARPVFADVDDSLTLDAASVAEAVVRARRGGLRARAVLPVHLFGRLADMEEIGAVAKAESLAIVEDAAQAVGARCTMGAAGALGDAAAFSFFPSKNLGAWGDGGAVTTNDVKVAERVRSLRQHGKVGADETFAEVGMNSRLDALHAAVLDVKARHLEAWNRARRAAAGRYAELLGGIEGLALPELAGEAHVHHVYAVRTAKRDALSGHLAARGVASRAYYARPVHQQPAYARFHDERAALPRTEAASGELLALPMYAEITPEQQAYVADAVRSFF
jgi:dTDP-4-amino-4,6-dideoxygalactose transaminase